MVAGLIERAGFFECAGAAGSGGVRPVEGMGLLVEVEAMMQRGGSIVRQVEGGGRESAPR